MLALGDTFVRYRNVLVASFLVNGLFMLALIVFFGGALTNDIQRGVIKSDATSVPASADVRAPLASPVSAKGAGVVTAVRAANPAVVSIDVARNVPSYLEQYYQQWQQGRSLKAPAADHRASKTALLLSASAHTAARASSTAASPQISIGGGSGFFISEDGLIVTNKHVVDDPSAIYTAITTDGKKYPLAVVYRDATLDIALLRAQGSNFPYLEFGDSSTVEPGQTVIAIGNALAEFNNSVSVGVVSGLSRSVVAGDTLGNAESIDELIQTDAAINPGSSGGPLLDLNGTVIGVTTARVAGSENIGFALPSNVVKKVVDFARTQKGF